jgi:hypothetical protein
VIPAGGSGTIVAKVKTKANQGGSFSKSITVATNVPGEEFLKLSLTYRAVAAILAEPMLGFRLDGIENESISGRILLQRSDGERLEVSMDTAPFPFDIEVRTERGNDTSGGENASSSDLWLEVTIPPQQETVRHSGNLRLKTNHPDAELLEVPINVWVRPVIDIRPKDIRIDVFEDPSRSRMIRVRLNHGDRTPFEVTAIEVSDPELLLVELDSDRKQPYHELSMKLADGVIASMMPEQVDATVRVSLSDPRRPIVEIPVTLVPRKSDPNPPFGIRRKTDDGDQ